MISLPASVLHTALSGLTKVASRRATLPVLRCLHVSQAGPAVRLTGTDLDAWLTYTYRNAPLPITALARKLEDIQSKLHRAEWLVDAETLRGVAKVADKDRFVEIDPTAQTVRYLVDGTLLTIPLPSVPALEQFPSPPTLPVVPFQPLPDAARDAIFQAMQCSSEDSTRYVLQGAYITREDDPSTGQPYPLGQPHHVIVGTDGRHLLRTNSHDLPLLDQSFILPAHPLLKSNLLADLPWSLVIHRTVTNRVEPSPAALQNYAHDLREYERLVKDDPEVEPPEAPQAYDETLPPKCQVQAGPWLLTTKTVDGNYPNYRQIIPHEFRIAVEIPAGSVPRLIESLPKLPVTDKNRSVSLSISPDAGLSFVVGQNALPTYAASATGSLKIAFNRDLVLKALRFGLRTIHFNDAMSPAVFSAPGRQLVVMPLRLS